MNKEDIIQEAIGEIATITLEQELFAESKKLLNDAIEQSIDKVNAILEKLSEDERWAINDHLDRIAVLADYESMCHYEQGTKDCVALLKHLGAFSANSITPD